MSWKHYATLCVVGIPKAQPRTKATAFGKHARVYTPATARSWKELIMFEATPYAGRLIDAPLQVTIQFRLPRPKAHKRDTLITTKPDIDNLIKSTTDALTDCGVWRDDSLIASIAANKIYAGGKMEPGATITIEIWSDKEDLEDGRSRRNAFQGRIRQTAGHYREDAFGLDQERKSQGGEAVAGVSPLIFDRPSSGPDA